MFFYNIFALLPLSTLAELEAMILFSSKVNGGGSLGFGGGISEGVPTGAMERYRHGPMLGDCAIVRKGGPAGKQVETSFR